MKDMVGVCMMLVFAAASGVAPCGHVPFAPLSEVDVARLYQQARVTPGARQIGLSCAFFANVPVLTMAGGINIADGSLESREFNSRIYALRHGDPTFMSAFDRGMFFDLFGIPSKPVTIYHREATRGELLADAEQIARRDLASALDAGQFASLRVIGDFGGPHNVLLLAHRAGTFHCHDPRTGKVKAWPAAEMASKILGVSKKGGVVKKRYFTSYHLISIPAPQALRPKVPGLEGLAEKLEIAPTSEQLAAISVILTPQGNGKDVVASFPGISLAVTGKGRSAISQELPAGGLYGVFNLSKLALNSYHIGARDILPVWMMAGGPMVFIGYTGGDVRTLVFTDGKRRMEMGLDEALVRFRERGCFFGYIVPGAA
ncbi:hypothetical protein HZ994_14625 [Akkermansiaceae bacterium]|nr:hypothetical protein HZ994_14625 [Akkermansiaceae bacterium]